MSSSIAGGQQTTKLASMLSDDRSSSLLFGFLAVMALLLGHVPLVLTYFRRLMLFEHYEFVPLLALGICVLLWGRMKEVSREDLLQGLQAGVPVRRLQVSGLMLAVASLFCSPWVAMLSLILSLGLFASSLSGRHWKTILPIWALSFLMVRPPLHLDLKLIRWLQLETSQLASLTLERLGVLHLMQGNVLIVPERRFLVEEACSGIHSVFALLTAAAFYSVCMHTPKLRGLLLMVSSVFWACFMNLVRIAATVLAFDGFGIDLSTGWVHSVTGLVTFFIAVILLAFTDCMLRFFLDPIDSQKVTYWKQEGNPFVRMWNGRPSRLRSSHASDPPAVEPSVSKPRITRSTSILVAGFSTLAILWQLNALRAETVDVQAPAVIANLTPKSLPFQLGTWVQVEYDIQRREDDPILSDVSKVWTYRGPALSALVSIDYPFQGWHHLTGCYQAQGWEIDSHQAVPLPGTHGRSLSEVRMHRPTGEQGLLLFVLVDEQGRPLRDPEVESWWRQIVGSSIERMQRPFARQLPALAPNSTVTTQIQMLITSAGETIPPSVREQARLHFNDLQSHVSDMLTSEPAVVMKGDTP